LVFITGCANHIKNVSLKDTQIDRKVTKEDYFMTFADQDKVIENPSINLKLEKQSHFKVEHYEVTQNKEMLTPYQGWREFYEVPMGIGLFPCAIVVNALDFATLGFIPNSFTDDLLDYSFTGMNPCLNIENEERVVYKVSKSDKKKIDSKVETTTSPAADMQVQLISASQQEPLLTGRTDKSGRIEINFFDEKLFTSDFHSQRELGLIVVDKKNAKVAEAQILIDRILSRRLKKAARLINEFHQNQTPEKLAATVWELEKLKFPKAALRLEKTNLNMHANDKTFISRFQKAMASTSPQALNE
jgi:hypothetical protein